MDYGFTVSEMEFSILSSMLNLGAAAVCILTGCMINFFGRRGTMLLAVIPFILGWCLLIAAVNVTMLILGRALCGMACGACCVSCPVNLYQISSKVTRQCFSFFLGVRFMLAKLLIKIFAGNSAHSFSFY